MRVFLDFLMETFASAPWRIDAAKITAGTATSR